ncbi:hypothetical protein LguiB_001808 [Lonicera macranthoides]
MGSLVGHVAPGFAFFVLGLWHLFNHIKLHALNPNTYTFFPWFPTPKIKYLELFIIMAASSASISMELFIGPRRHQPLDTDGTIPSNHLHNFEHSSISATFLIYALSTLVLDKTRPKVPQYVGLTQLIGSIAFAQQLLLFHFHSSDHVGLESQYHFLLQMIIFVSLTTTLMCVSYSKSFLVSFVRSLSVVFQGIWLMVMGIMLWTPQFVPKGCFLNFEVGHYVVHCHSEEALNRAKALVNIEFSWYLIGMAIFGVSIYLVVTKIYSKKVEYQAILAFHEELEEEEPIDAEGQKMSVIGESKSFIHMGKEFVPLDLER